MRYNNHDNDKKFQKRREKQYKGLWGKDCYRHPGQFRKQHPLDCGNTKCMICHSQKILDIKTHKQEIEDLRYKEQLD